ncbi:COPII coat Sec23p-Sfb3p heterodimer component [Mucor velutinosus]|uniref:COPII coat Sec23p-Sfb3p heterodimer component n=1 Tax=Mucor velutinosus TaxID=708070 RepID=A0AAN7DFZ8_9FUNG|nr:COPII coat Sec23p-Sfb3p heterodimer component [Mucor velutinosus]
MNKLFRRHNQEPIEKRSGAFIKRLEESKRSVVMDPQRASDMEALMATPKVQVDDLSDIELSAYQAWWKDLDPFYIGKADNEAVFHFVSGCGLPDHTLEEILALFQDQKEGLTKEEFFAILRLIAHAQNGRMVSKDIVYLGAPLPRFQTQAIDAIIKRSQQQQQQQQPASDTDTSRSYDSTASHNNISSSSPMPSWMMPMNKVAGAQSTIIPHAILSRTPTKSPYDTPTTQVSHSRSRSVPYNFLSQMEDTSVDMKQITDASFDPAAKPAHQRRSTNHSSHVSMDADSLQKIMDTGQSLLLTQSFRPDFIDDDDDDSRQEEDEDEPGVTTASSAESSNNNSASSSGKLKSLTSRSYNPYLAAAPSTTTTTTTTNPFETDDSSSTTPTQTPTMLPFTPTTTQQNTLYHQTANTCMNSRQIPPPPVPPQSTKPAYPKYARRTLY